MLVSNTPIETYTVKGKTVYVKREDLSSPFPGPANAKARGIDRFLRELAEKNIKRVGVLDTKISRTGWIVSWLARQYDIEVFDFYPAYKNDKEELRFAQKMAKYFGAILVPQPAGRDWYRYALARRYMKTLPDSTMLPDKLRFVGATLSVAEELQYVEEDLLKGTIVVAIGSGTIMSGVIKGLADRKITPKYIVGPLCASEATVKSRYRYIMELLDKFLSARFLAKARLILVPSRWSYFKPIYVRTPFPCDPYYDRKAWYWLVKHIKNLPEPILFWNIGGEWDLYHGMAKGMRGDGRITKKEFDEFYEKELKNI